jgi:hypothetical protein
MNNICSAAEIYCRTPRIYLHDPGQRRGTAHPIAFPMPGQELSGSTHHACGGARVTGARVMIRPCRHSPVRGWLTPPRRHPRSADPAGRLRWRVRPCVGANRGLAPTQPGRPNPSHDGCRDIQLGRPVFQRHGPNGTMTPCRYPSSPVRKPDELSVRRNPVLPVRPGQPSCGVRGRHRPLRADDAGKGWTRCRSRGAAAMRRPVPRPAAAIRCPSGSSSRGPHAPRCGSA